MASVRETLTFEKELHPSGKDAQIIVGIAGPPGGGKSTLAKQVCRQFRKLEEGRVTNTPSSGGDRGGGVNEELKRTRTRRMKTNRILIIIIVTTRARRMT